VNCSGCGATAVMFDSYGGQINTWASDWTSFPHRNMLFHIQTLIYWNNNTLSREPATSWIDHFYNDMLSYVSPFAYVNYIDGNLQQWAYAYYADNFPQLATIKAKYDPLDLFHYAQSIFFVQ